MIRVWSVFRQCVASPFKYWWIPSKWFPGPPLAKLLVCMRCPGISALQVTSLEWVWPGFFWMKLEHKIQVGKELIKNMSTLTPPPTRYLVDYWYTLITSLLFDVWILRKIAKSSDSKQRNQWNDIAIKTTVCCYARNFDEMSKIWRDV